MSNRPWNGREFLTGQGLGAFLSADAPADLARVLGALADASVSIAALVRRGGLSAAPAAAISASPAGFVRTAPAIFVDEAFIRRLQGSGVRGVVSGERDEPAALDSDGTLLAAIGPLDGASTLDADVPVGAVFSVLDAPAGPLKPAHFLQAGIRQRAAGFVLFGAHVAFVFTTGAGVHIAILDPDSNAFRILRADARIPERGGALAIDPSNARNWPGPVRAYVEDCLEGENGSEGRNLDMRWVGSMVAEAYRILTRGGVYLDPEDSREGHANGSARLLSQANPIAFLIEQAGGAAINGFDRILEIAPRSVSMRTPLIFGAKDRVERIARYCGEGNARANSSPLFGKRGLLRR